MTDPVFTANDFHRIVDAEATWFRSYMTALAKRADPRLGARVMPLHDCGCFATRFDCSVQDTFRNRVIGAHRVPVEDLPDVIARAREFFSGSERAALDVVPGAWSRESLGCLREHGVDRSLFAFQAQYRGRARDTAAELAALAATGVVVRRSRPDDTEAFIRVYAISDEMALTKESGLTMNDIARAESLAIADLPDWIAFTAEIDGQPHGFGLLHLADNPELRVGSCSGGWVHPDGRRRGGQRALLLARIGHAHAAGCDLVLSQTGSDPDNPSARNIRRAGLELAWNATWMNLTGA